jgi:DNA-binding transcriptional MerR regulator
MQPEPRQVLDHLGRGSSAGPGGGYGALSRRPDAAVAAEVGFRGPQVCAIVGITYRQLDYWARTGLLRPSITDARGSGTQRIYSYTDLVQLKVIKQLLDAGVSLRSTRKAIECLRASGRDVASSSLVIVDDRTVLAHSGEELFDLLRGGQGVLSIVLGLEKIVQDLDAAILELNAARAAKAERGLAKQPSADGAVQTSGAEAVQPGAQVASALASG